MSKETGQTGATDWANPPDLIKYGAKVAVIGAAGGIGQPLSLLLKIQPSYISHLAMYDVVNCPGVVADLSHVNQFNKVTSHQGQELVDCVRDAHIIIIPAGRPQKPGQTRDDLFDSNAKIIVDIAKVCAEHAPKALMAIISNPVNSLVPLVSEVYKKMNCYDSNRIFGVCTLDVVRASTFVARDMFKPPIDPQTVNVPVVGGHAGKTIMPLLSQATPTIPAAAMADQALVDKTIKNIQEGGIHVLEAKAGTGTATLAMAYAGARFVMSLLKGLRNESNIVECAYIKSDVVPGVGYFSTPILLGPNGVAKNLGLGKLNEHEQQMLSKAAEELKLSIAKGEDYLKRHPLASSGAIATTQTLKSSLGRKSSPSLKKKKF